MSTLTEPVAKQARLATSPRSAKDWLDALATEGCNQAEFLAGIGVLVRKSPDAGWDLLALVDQYYRLGKINAATFETLKQHLQSLMVGSGRSRGMSVPHADVPTLRVTAMPGPTAKSEPVAPALASQPASLGAPLGDQPATEPRTLAVGDVLRNRYRIQGILGRGGMGTVFAAIDEFRLGRSPGDQRVALKVLHTEVIKRPQLFAELRTEFQHLQSLSHPNIVRVHEFDRDGDLAFFTMEILSGALLSRVVPNEGGSPLYRPYALAIVRDVGAAVAHAHARGVVHGDLNPANIFLTDNGEVRVLDFGASHQLHRGPWISDFESSPRLQVATPSYASCQVLEGETADARDDVYALACIAYLLLSGRHPFGNETALKARTALASPQRPPAISRHEWAALRDGLNFDRERRPADLAAWLRRLNLQGAAPHLPELQAMSTRRSRPVSVLKGAAWALGVVMVAAALGYAATHVDEATRAWWSVSAGVPSLRSREPVLVAATPDSNAVPATTLDKPSSAPPDENAGVPTPDAPSAESTAPAATTPVPAVPPVAVTQPSVTAAPATQSPGPGAHARIELAADNIDVGAGESSVNVVVRRTRSWREDVSFKWWTESGTAKPGHDFVASSPQTEHIAGGKNSITLVVPLFADPGRRTPRSFYIVIDEASDNAALGPRTLTQITLPGTQ